MKGYIFLRETDQGVQWKLEIPSLHPAQWTFESTATDRDAAIDIATDIAHRAAGLVPDVLDLVESS